MTKYAHQTLIQFATDLLVKAGLPNDRASITAETLVESDLMGHFTHGLALMTPYLEDALKGGMQMSGEPEVIKDTGSSIAWNGKYMSGPWLTHKAIDLAFERVKEHSVVTLTIQQCHHIGCLAAYPERATEKGLMMLLSCSDPRNATVAPYGGLEGVYSPNPLAIGFPTEGQPVIIDISMSTTANGLINQSYAQDKKLPHPWLLDNKGEITDDPAAFMEEPPATILPLGGLDTGYKGFGLGLLVEMLTSGLAGHGRADHPTNWGASVFLQIFDPAGFGGLDNFKRQAQFLAKASLNSKPSDPNQPVRLPGSRALDLRDKQKKDGVVLAPSIVTSLEKWAKELGVGMPKERS